MNIEGGENFRSARLSQTKGTILLVTGHLVTAKEIESNLKSIGFTVHSVANIQEAFIALISVAATVVISDFILPDGDVSQLINRVRMRGLKLPFIVASSQPVRSLYLDESLNEVEAFYQSPIADWPGFLHCVNTVVDNAAAKAARRKFHRLYCNLDVDFESSQGGAIQTCKGINLAKGGMFFSVSHGIPRVGDFVAFRIMPTTYFPMEVEGVGIVRWIRRDTSTSQPCGFGIEFFSMTDEGKHQIEELLGQIARHQPHEDQSVQQ